MPQVAEVGRLGDNVRSDCWVKLTLEDFGGISINLTSKVDFLYGDNIRQIINDVLAFFSIKHASVEVVDQGALPFVIAARLETAIKRCLPGVGLNYILPERKACTCPPTRERFRRSRLYLPGNEPKFMINAGLHEPDGIILDLEDSVAISEKDAARTLVRNALCQVDFYQAERMVRINQLPLGLVDLVVVVPHNVHVILIPKCESAAQVQKVDEDCTKILKRVGIAGNVYLMPIIESALGAMNAYEIAMASPNNIALTIGLEDYTADLGTQRTLEGHESFWARSQVVNAARAAGIQAIDTVFSDVSDMDGLRESVREAKALGFEGKGCIHPRQIHPIHEVFAPEASELSKAQKIVLAFEEAQKKGLGVISLGSKMIDPPVVKRAQKTVELALMSGLIDENWREGGLENG